MSATARIPFTVVGGFLGAGKTTLVNHLLREAAAADAGRRVAVLVNDFGAINIDAALIASRTVDAIGLANGCVCCQIGDDLAAALIRVLDAEPPFDAIVVEASGVSDPWRIAQIARAEPTLTLAGVVVLADAGTIFAQGRDPLLADTIERQLRAADVVLLNKVDRASAAEQEQARAWIEAVAGSIEVIATSEAAPAPGLWFEAFDRIGERAWTMRPLRSAAHGRRFESRVFRPSSPLSAPALRALLRAMPPGVLRLKGIVATDAHPWAELQFSGRHGSLRPALSAPVDGEAAIVAIGLAGRLPCAALASALAAAGSAGISAAATDTGSGV
jgi:G3E family GTPase